jgi:hypothetical protein
VDFVANFFNLDCIASGMNDGITGMAPIEMKELTKLQDLYLSGTALTGSLPLDFCFGDVNITNFEADCAGGDEAEVQCPCCTVCCGRIDDEPYTCGGNPFTKPLSLLLAEADVDRRALSSPGAPQYQALHWLVYNDPANLDFEHGPPDELLERFVMALLYFSMGGETWDNSFGFLSASSVCMWMNESNDGSSTYGVLCDPMVVESYPMIVQIDMEQNNLHGQLPTELGLLSNLQYLGLDKNQISGRIPSELGRLTSLGALHLSKFATISSSALDLIICWDLSNNLSPLLVLQAPMI